MTAQSERIVAYVRPSVREQITQAVEASGQTQQDWLRAALTAALEPRPEQASDDSLLSVKLEAAHAEILRLEEHLRDARDQRDAANASNERLETLVAQSQATVNNLTRALPPAGGSSWWRFWARP